MCCGFDYVCVFIGAEIFNEINALTDFAQVAQVLKWMMSPKGPFSNISSIEETS